MHSSLHDRRYAAGESEALIRHKNAQDGSKQAYPSQAQCCARKSRSSAQNAPYAQSKNAPNPPSTAKPTTFFPNPAAAGAAPELVGEAAAPVAVELPPFDVVRTLVDVVVAAAAAAVVVVGTSVISTNLIVLPPATTSPPLATETRTPPTTASPPPAESEWPAIATMPREERFRVSEIDVCNLV